MTAQEEWIIGADAQEETKPDLPVFALGVHENVSNEDYHRSHGVSNSSLRLILRSPAHYRKRASFTSTRAMEIGSAIHCAILEPERYASDYKIVECDARTSAMYKAACKDRSKDMVLTSAEGDGVSGMSAAIYSDPDALEILNAPGRNELSVFAKDPETGLIVKCRFDRLNNDLMAADIKKTQDAREDAFSRTVNTYLYHMQAAFYSDVFEWATGEQLRGFDFIAVEERPPHACKVYGLDEEALMIGRAMYREALTVYAKCVDSGKWPAYSGGRKVIGLPGYAISQFEDELEVTFDE